MNLLPRRKITHKFHARRCEVDGKKFPSKLEARYYRHLKTIKLSGELLFFLRQVPFELPGGISYRVDFVLFWASGDVEFVDVKGMETPISKMKIKQVEEIYPVEIKIIKSV